MRLIDADEFEEKLASIALLAKSDQQKALIGRAMYCLDNMPTAYDVEKVVEQLMHPSNYTIVAGKHHTTVERAIEIVRNGGKE